MDQTDNTSWETHRNFPLEGEELPEETPESNPEQTKNPDAGRSG